MSVDGLSGRQGTAAPAQGVPASAPVDVPLTRWQKFRMVVKVVELRLRFIALMVITGAVFGYWDTIWNHYEKWNRPPGARLAEGPAESDHEFYCPMHPTVVRVEPGGCPICGMPLSRRTRGVTEPLPEGVTARLSLAPARIVQAGIRTAEVGYAPLATTLTTVGSVRFDERRRARIDSKIKGMARVETLYVNFTGTPVEAGQPLAELYSPELYQAVQELLLARRSAREAPRMQSSLGRSVLGDPGELTRLAAEKLKLWGLTQGQVDDILKQGKAGYRVPILAPIGGVVVRKNVVEGQYVAEGEPMFEVADLRHVWIEAQVYEDQFASVQVGQAVGATVQAFPGEVFPGTVAFIDPTFDAATRTVGVRYDLENHSLRLRPGMFAHVTLKTPVADTPAFRARTAEARGPAGPARRLGLTAEEQQVCPVTSARLGSMGDPVQVEVEGEKVWTCCGSCEPRLRGDPARYLARLRPAPGEGVLTVPESAVIDTGTRQVVYVETEPGTFEGRPVVLGPRSGDRYPVLEGLRPGDRVAAAGAFLIDAETRLNPAAGASYHGGSGPHRDAATREGTEEAPPRPVASPPRSAAAVEPVHRH